MAQVANPKMCGHLRDVHITDGRLPISDFTVLIAVMLGICYPARWERALVSIAPTKGYYGIMCLIYYPWFYETYVQLKLIVRKLTKTSLYSTLII
jgi:hypothetical protein